MKKSYEFICFLSLQICLALLYIYKESTFIALFYKHQKMEKNYDELVSQTQELSHQLQKLHNRSLIQSHAQKNGLDPLPLSAVRYLHADQST